MKSRLKLFYLTTVFLLLCSTNCSTQTASKFKSYPIDYTQKTGVFVERPTPAILFNKEYLLNTTAPNGKKMFSKVEKITIKGNNITYIISSYVGTKKFIICTIILQKKDVEGLNYIVYYRIKNLISSSAEEFSYDGSEYSMGQIIAAFSGFAQYFFNIEKINKKLSEVNE